MFSQSNPKNRVLMSFILLLFFEVSCTKQGGSQNADMLSIYLSKDPISLNPTQAEDGNALKVLSNVMEGALGYDSIGNLENRLAEKVLEDRTHKQIKIYLKENLYWSDGNPVEAAEFKYALDQVLSPTSTSKLKDLFHPIKKIEVVDTRLFVLHLKYNAPYVKHLLALSQSFPQRKDIPWSIDAPITGAFKISQYKVGQKIELEPNVYYWRGSKAVLPKHVVVRIIEDESTAAHLFLEKKIDVLSRVPVFQLKLFEQKGLLRVDPYYAVYYLSFNASKTPFNQKSMRKVFAQSIHQKDIVSILQSGEKPAKDYIPMGLEGWESSGLSDLKKEKIPQSFNFKIGFGFDSNARNQLIAEKIQSDIQSALGLKLDLMGLDWKTYVRLLGTDAPNVFRFAWLAPISDPIVHLKVFYSKNPNNYSHWSNKNYDRLVDEIEQLESGKERVLKIQKAQKILLDEEAILVPLYYYNQLHAVNADLKGFSVNPFGVTEWRTLQLKQD